MVGAARGCPPPAKSAAAPTPFPAGDGGTPSSPLRTRWEVVFPSELLLSPPAQRTPRAPSAPHPQPLHTFSPSIFRPTTDPAQLPAWGESHGPVCPRRGGKRRGSEECTAHAGEQMCLAPRAHPWPGPESRSSALRPRNIIICSSVQSSFYRKKNVKKYKLLPREIKVPLSGASGGAGSWGGRAGEWRSHSNPTSKCSPQRILCPFGFPGCAARLRACLGRAEEPGLARPGARRRALRLQTRPRDGIAGRGAW